MRLTLAPKTQPSYSIGRDYVVLEPTSFLILKDLEVDSSSSISKSGYSQDNEDTNRRPGNIILVREPLTGNILEVGITKLSSKHTPSRVFFYPFKPDEIPVTHRYRAISFPEFEKLVTEVRPPIKVRGDHEKFVLYKLVGAASNIHHIKYDESFPLPELGDNDIAVLINHYGVSTFMGWISPQRKEDILEKTRFGIIEPV